MEGALSIFFPCLLSQADPFRHPSPSHGPEMGPSSGDAVMGGLVHLLRFYFEDRWLRGWAVQMYSLCATWEQLSCVQILSLFIKRIAAECLAGILFLFKLFIQQTSMEYLC